MIKRSAAGVAANQNRSKKSFAKIENLLRLFDLKSWAAADQNWSKQSFAKIDWKFIKIIWLKMWSSRRSNLIFANILKRRPAESFNLAVDANKQGVLFHFNFPLGRLLIVIIIVVILRDFLSRGPTDDLSEVHRLKKRDSLLRSIYREIGG